VQLPPGSRSSAAGRLDRREPPKSVPRSRTLSRHSRPSCAVLGRGRL
jgi:hypothetical protein